MTTAQGRSAVARIIQEIPIPFVFRDKVVERSEQNSTNPPKFNFLQAPHPWGKK